MGGGAPPRSFGSFMHSEGLQTAGARFGIWLLTLVVSIFLIQIIWNHVIVRKFPASRIQPLTFWDSLALAVFVSLMAGAGPAMMSIKGGA